jgi:hypothetical protein
MRDHIDFDGNVVNRRPHIQVRQSNIDSCQDLPD